MSYKCPDCESGTDIVITCEQTHKVYIDEEGNVDFSEEQNGFEWDNENEAECTACSWSGTVGELHDTDDEEDAITEEEEATLS